MSPPGAHSRDRRLIRTTGAIKDWSLALPLMQVTRKPADRSSSVNDTPPTPTKALVPSPPARRRRLLAAVPDTVVTPPPRNMQKSNSGLQDLNFKVDPNFHTAFKVIAAIEGMPMKDLLEASFSAWVEKFSDDQIRAITATLPAR
jgi:hypothetical protein